MIRLESDKSARFTFPTYVCCLIYSISAVLTSCGSFQKKCSSKAIQKICKYLSKTNMADAWSRLNISCRTNLSIMHFNGFQAAKQESGYESLTIHSIFSLHILEKAEPLMLFCYVNTSVGRQGVTRWCQVPVDKTNTLLSRAGPMFGLVFIGSTYPTIHDVDFDQQHMVTLRSK